MCRVWRCARAANAASAPSGQAGQLKFIPKNPVLTVRGKKMTATRESYAPAPTERFSQGGSTVIECCQDQGLDELQVITTLRQAARRLIVSLATIYEWRHTKKLGPDRTGQVSYQWAPWMAPLLVIHHSSMLLGMRDTTAMPPSGVAVPAGASG